MAVSPFRFRVPAVGSPSCCEGEQCCTTRRQNTHGTCERELLYPWHPWTGCRIYVHEVIEKNGLAVFRCSQSGSDCDRLLEVPGWMFDRAASGGWLLASAPQVSLAAINALSALLIDGGATSQSEKIGAASGSQDTIRGDADASPAHSLPVRPVPNSKRRTNGARAAVADLAGRDTPEAEATDGALDPRSRHGGTDKITGGRGS